MRSHYIINSHSPAHVLWNILYDHRVLMCSLTEHTIMVHIALHQVILQFQRIDWTVYITLSQSGCMDAFTS